MRRNSMLYLLRGVVLVLPLCGACTPSVTSPPPAPAVETVQEYLLGPEDVVDVQVWKNPDLTRVVHVRPDGKISLPLVGDVQAAGLTATQLAEKITEKLKEFYKELPQVTIIVQQVNSYAIYVLGEVRNQGKHLVRTGTTFLQALTIAGGFTQFASTNKVVIRRRNAEGKEVSIPLRYKDIVAGSQGNLTLRPGDVIIVP